MINIRTTVSFIFYTILLCSCSSEKKSTRDRIDLSGSWEVALDTTSIILTPEIIATFHKDTLSLPGTTDIAKLGFTEKRMDKTFALSRKFGFEGRAIYQKEIEIPINWNSRNISLVMERTKPTIVYIDDVEAGRNDNISTTQVYNLSDKLSPGKHKIAIVVDNRKQAVPEQVFTSSHAYSASTQTNWNGIIGDFFIESAPLTRIDDIQVFPSAKNKNAILRIKLKNDSQSNSNGKLIIVSDVWNTSKKYPKVTFKKDINFTDSLITLELPLGDRPAYWSEFSPALYKLKVELTSGSEKDIQEVGFGLRDFTTNGKQFVINDKVTFLRGKHDACVFPLTAHSAMDLETWRHYFKIAKEYGINHYRFHSWCPPKACFDAADIEGIYLQPELPIWGELNINDSILCQYLLKEGDNIHRAYSNHPSFVMFALGNEMRGEEGLISFVDHFRKVDNRHLYAAGSNNFLGFSGKLNGEDYYTTCRVGAEVKDSFNTHTRASFSFADAYDGGYLNHSYPNTNMDFSVANRLCDVPVISHETGQFQIYPDYNEIKKYTGVLQPYNFEIFKERLEKAGMIDQAHDFMMASGKWAAILYKADMEMNFRTPKWGGFQLLDLQDYPGQGSAYVGILDAFMDSKGLISSSEWRESCDAMVLLFCGNGYCKTNNQSLDGTIRIANYTENDLTNQTLNWSLKGDNGLNPIQGKQVVSAMQGKVDSVMHINCPLSSFTKPQKLELSIWLSELPYKNTYSFWVYPSDQTIDRKEIMEASDLTPEVMDELSKGRKVLLTPCKEKYVSQTVGGLFQTDYWNYRMFKTICENLKKPVSPGTLGLLTDSNHPIFKDFPTDSHTNWQWFPVIKNSNPMILDALPGYKPIVQVIDNIERNHRLGLIFEFSIGKGKLLVCMTNFKDASSKVEGKQLYKSIINYMNSSEFNPKSSLSSTQLKELFSWKAGETEIKELNNISY